MLDNYGVHHNVATPLHSQKNGQVELPNLEIMLILVKTVNVNRKDWSWKQDDNS